MMKADSTPILYIIISIVVLIISALGKSKKKVLQQPSTDSEGTEDHRPEPKPNWQKELEDIFGNVLEEVPKEVAEKPRYEGPKMPETVVKEPSWMTEHQMSEIPINEAESLETIVDETKTQYQHPVIQAIHNEEQEVAGVNLEEIELEKAIIYSEVINRKYF